MPKNGWFHSHYQNFDENEAHRQIDDYPHTEHPDDQLKLFIFWQNRKMITELTLGKYAQNLILHQK